MSEHDVICDKASDACAESPDRRGKNCPHRHAHTFSREECGGSYCPVLHAIDGRKEWGECKRIWQQVLSS